MTNFHKNRYRSLLVSRPETVSFVENGSMTETLHFFYVLLTVHPCIIL